MESGPSLRQPAAHTHAPLLTAATNYTKVPLISNSNMDIAITAATSVASTAQRIVTESQVMGQPLLGCIVVELIQLGECTGINDVCIADVLSYRFHGSTANHSTYKHTYTYVYMYVMKNTQHFTVYRFRVIVCSKKGRKQLSMPGEFNNFYLCKSFKIIL